MENATLVTGDCLEVLRSMPDRSVDLVFCSPPYEDARTYGIGFSLKGQAWVDWCVERYVECDRVCRGMTCWVVQGKTRKFRWSATPLLLGADLHRRGISLRQCGFMRRDGIPGAGGPDDFKPVVEYIIRSSHGRLPWSDNTATGHPPKYPPGGRPSHRTRDGRVNRPRLQREHGDDDKAVREYRPPKKANPGNLIDCGPCGGGHLGSRLAHENEAPFPERLVEPYILSFCPPGGVVLDPFCGSGTTIAVAIKHGRRAIGIDVRESQIELTRRRIAELAS